jgi:hypothetical protein
VIRPRRPPVSIIFNGLQSFGSFLLETGAAGSFIPGDGHLGLERGLV